MKDPFAPDATARRDNRLAADPAIAALARRLFLLRLGTGVLALLLLGAVLIVARWS